MFWWHAISTTVLILIICSKSSRITLISGQNWGNIFIIVDCCMMRVLKFLTNSSRFILFFIFIFNPLRRIWFFLYDWSFFMGALVAIVLKHHRSVLQIQAFFSFRILSSHSSTWDLLRIMVSTLIYRHRWHFFVVVICFIHCSLFSILTWCVMVLEIILLWYHGWPCSTFLFIMMIFYKWFFRKIKFFSLINTWHKKIWVSTRILRFKIKIHKFTWSVVLLLQIWLELGWSRIRIFLNTASSYHSTRPW